MPFTKDELQLIEQSLRNTLVHRGGADRDIEQLIEKIVEQNTKNEKGGI